VQAHLLVLLLQASTCADVSPVAKPGIKFACPTDTEFNPAMADALQPRAKSCCKVRKLCFVPDMSTACYRQH
jgi:hypothetical protein